MLENTPEARLRCSSISLEDGADEAWMNGEPIWFRDGGMSFPSRWQFTPGTTLAMTLELCGSRERVQTEALVVGCEKTRDRLWLVTVLFLEIPAGLVKIQERQVEIQEGFDEAQV